MEEEEEEDGGTEEGCLDPELAGASRLFSLSVRVFAYSHVCFAGSTTL